MPYDILQLNDMLIPELLDVADNLKIDNARGYDKPALIYKILDQQAINGKSGEDPAKKKRGPKPKAAPAAKAAAPVQQAAAPTPAPAPEVVDAKEEVTAGYIADQSTEKKKKRP